jgi:O-antigen/teichoic acid export membrane protein
LSEIIPSSEIRYQTATATFIQFITLTILGFPNAIVSIVSTCHSDSSNCVSNSIVSLVFFLLTAAWFAFILFVGYTAQKRRSRRLAFILVGCETVNLFVAGIINFPRETNYLSKSTSLVDALLSILVLYLATRLFFAGNKRVVKKTIIPKK